MMLLLAAYISFTTTCKFTVQCSLVTSLFDCWILMFQWESLIPIDFHMGNTGNGGKHLVIYISVSSNMADT